MLQEMLKKANEAMQKSYSPYSNFPVGACIRVKDNTLFVGCNYEIDSFSLTLCAESVAIGAMITAGYRLIEEIIIVAEKKIICPPCGACRQRIKEFSSPTTKIHLGHKDIIHQTLTIEELLPLSFELNEQ